MQPYLLRALYDWITDNGLTPYLLVNADYEDVEVPTEFVEEGKIILNIAPMAVQALTLEDDWVSFRTRFSGRSFSVYVPVPAVLAIYAKENSKGMFFRPKDSEDSEKAEEATPPSPLPPQKPPRRQKPVLKRVK